MSQFSRAIHIYQRSVEGFVVFYTLHDYLALYTLVSVTARKYRVRVLGLAIMYNHIHLLVVANSRDQIQPFVSEYTKRFARIYNAEAGIEGHLFHNPFGSAVKYGDKNIRTAAGYLYNNHTNKKLCNRAEDIRWNFLAYAHDTHPFSNLLKRKEASAALRRALKIVDIDRSADNSLGYATLKRIYKGLNATEKNQVTDYIVNEYRFVDYEALEGLYRSYDDMILSFNANTFNEYDIDEEAEERNGDDRVYNLLSRHIISSGKFDNLKSLLFLPSDDRLRLAVELRAATGISYKQIGDFLHMRIHRVSNVVKEYEALEQFPA